MAIVCTLDAAGIHAPAFSDILAYLKDAYRGIYGSDVYLENDSQDGQLLGVFAKAIYDCNAQTVAVYNAFSPATAQGAGLSSVVKINGIARRVASQSTADVRLIGQAGTTITNGIVADAAGNRWDLPATVTIPDEGEITVTATAQQLGAITAAANTITTIATPTRGWQLVTNPSAATPGAPVETDAQLRQRQSVSVALPSLTVLQGTIGAVADVPGVQRYKAYENDTGATDANGIPGHTISLVVDGGDAQAIANAIALKKTPGTGTFGNTAVDVTSAYGIPETIRFSRPAQVPIIVAISIKALSGYSSVIGNEIVSAVMGFINDLPIGGVELATGQGVPYARIFVPAQLSGPYASPASPSDASTYEILSIGIAKANVPSPVPAPQDLLLAYNEAATCTVADIVLTVT